MRYEILVATAKRESGKKGRKKVVKKRRKMADGIGSVLAEYRSPIQLISHGSSSLIVLLAFS